MSLHIVILAAGQGKRMHSATPKILHPVGGKPMFERVLDVAYALEPEKIHVVIGHAADQIRSHYTELSVNWVMQTPALGTGHSVLQALPFIPEKSQVLVLYSDTPLLQKEPLQQLVRTCHQAIEQQALGLILANIPNPFGLGRIIRDAQQNITAIVEEKDADTAQRLITEIYPGICCTSAANLNRWLPKLTNHNAQGEYYLTDIIAMAHVEQRPILSLHAPDYHDVLGVNDRLQLQDAERIWQRRKAQALMLSGVTLSDAQRIDIRGSLQCAQDVFIDVNNVFVGDNQIGEATVIEPNCLLTNVSIGKRCRILASSVLEGCVIEDDCQVGPFARIRPGTHLAAHCSIGNFVEAKKVIMGPHSKASHLSYLGDAVIGQDVNIGAGTITCNYDGANKHQTIIEDGVHIGSDTQLVAPVTIGTNATIGAGSTIRRDVPADELTLTINQQKTIYGWKRKHKSKSNT